MNAPASAFYDDLVLTEKSYYYKVVAKTNSNISYHSNYVIGHARLATPVVTTSNSLAGKPVLSWTDCKASQYGVYKKTSSASQGRIAMVSGTEFEDKDAEACTTATYEVMAISNVSAKYNSELSQGRTVACKLPYVQIKSFEMPNNVPTIGWEAVPGADYYKVQCLTQGSTINVGTTTGTSITHPNAPTGEMVSYCVVAYTNAGTQYSSTYVSYNHYWQPSSSLIYSAKAIYPTIAKSAQQEFEVVTTSNVQTLMLYAEGGSPLVKTWAASENSTVSGDKRTWKVSHAIGTAGDRKLVFKGGITNTTPVTSPVTVSFKVVNTGVISASAKNATIKKGGEQRFTVKTTSDAKYLMEYAENGNLVKTWTASSSNSTVSGSVRTWTVSQNIATAGKRTLSFKAGTTSTPTAAQRTATFTVEDVWVNSASVKFATIGKGGTQTFTVKTTSNAQYLMLYGEGGNLVKTWGASGNSSVSGDVRTWTVSLAIGTAGNRELTLKAGKTTTPSSFGKTVKFAVVEKKLISAKAKLAAIAKGATQTFEVETSADVKNLMLYAEGGNLVKSWAASGNSTETAQKTRKWTVSLTIGTVGDRKLVFKGGTTNTTPVTNALAVSFKVENIEVISVSAKYATINRGTEQVFTVKTSADAKYLVEYAEDGKTVAKTWTASSSNSTVSGNVRTWTLTQTINTAGNRKLYFKAGSTSTPTSAAKSVSFVVK